ncbi:acetyltransferase [Stieleria tagensis]|uniref:acetyltransferase n=1 Tax=Stieleria tagensis TaxID=2956795 RepID=UPI00209AA636|nr:acetyltransferase [Stieleria tagensis]
MKEISTGDLIRVDDIEQLCSPMTETVSGRRQAGEEEQESEPYCKSDLSFPSGEALPRAWKDKAYQLTVTKTG